DVRLREIEPQAAVETRPSSMRAGRSRAAEEVQVMVLGVDAPLFLGPVADAEIHTLMVALRDGDPHRHLVGLQLGAQRLDVGKLKQLEAVEPALRFLDHAAAIEI